MAANKLRIQLWKESRTDPAGFEVLLFVFLLMTVFSQSFFSLVRRNFMTLTFFTTRHLECVFS